MLLLAVSRAILQNLQCLKENFMIGFKEYTLITRKIRLYAYKNKILNGGKYDVSKDGKDW